MLPTSKAHQSAAELIYIDDLVPDDHLLRKIDAAIDFSFIRDRVKHLYSADNGRPAVDPVLLFKMLFIGYLYGIRSERQLVREIQVNVAYRWFLGLDLRDKVPDASTISQNRRRRFRESTIFQEIFDEIVLLAIRRGLVDGRVLFTDSTHLKASANKKKFKKRQVTVATKSYLSDLEEAVDADRLAHGKKPLKKRDNDDSSPPATKEIKVSTTDPDSGFMVRDGKPQGFFYLDHRTVDNKAGIITDTHVTPGNVHDSTPYLERLDAQICKFHFPVERVGHDAGYNTAAICKGLEDRKIDGVIGSVRTTRKKGMLAKRLFVYDSLGDVYHCPGGQTLPYRTTTREGYQEYVSDPSRCVLCPLLQQCTESANHRKVVTRHVWQASREKMIATARTERGRATYRRRRETVERSFGEAKQLYGHRYARLRSIAGAREQCLLSAACQNMKKIAMTMAKHPSISRLWTYLAGLLSQRTTLNGLDRKIERRTKHNLPTIPQIQPVGCAV